MSEADTRLLNDLQELHNKSVFEGQRNIIKRAIARLTELLHNPAPAHIGERVDFT